MPPSLGRGCRALLPAACHANTLPLPSALMGWHAAAVVGCCGHRALPSSHGCGMPIALQPVTVCPGVPPRVPWWGGALLWWPSHVPRVSLSAWGGLLNASHRPAWLRRETVSRLSAGSGLPLRWGLWWSASAWPCMPLHRACIIVGQLRYSGIKKRGKNPFSLWLAMTAKPPCQPTAN